LHVIHRGVYAVGHRVMSIHARWMAAVLAGGSGAALSHRAAAALWLLHEPVRLEVTVAGAGRSRPGVRFHRSLLAEDEVTAVQGIPVTSVPRTLLDLAAVLPRHRVERAINEAEVRGLSDPLSLADLVDRYPGRRGICAVKAILSRLQAGVRMTRSELESRFLGFARRNHLPAPEVNAHLFVRGRWIECDCVWRTQRLVVELDGRAVHTTAAAFERDRARDRALHAAGWRSVRVTWRQLHDDAGALAADLHAILAGPPSRP
jgi:very-short-patch-repair endonuclease